MATTAVKKTKTTETATESVAASVLFCRIALCEREKLYLKKKKDTAVIKRSVCKISFEF